MATLNFYINGNKKSKKEVSIWFRLRNGRDTDIRLSTGVSIPFEYWDINKGQPKEFTKATTDSARIIEIGNKLKGINSAIMSIKDTHERLTSDIVKKCMKDYLDSLKIKPSDAPQTMNEYLSKIISQMVDGSRRNGSHPYSKGTIKAWNSFNKTWLAFQTDYLERKLNFDDIDMEVYNDFITYCNEKEYSRKKKDDTKTTTSTAKESEQKEIGYRESTKSKYITSLKVLLSFANEAGLTTNDIHTKRGFSKQQRDAGGKKTYLTTNEIDKLFKLELESGSMLDKVRDVFLIGCYTGQRVSDYANINKGNIDTMADGSKVFRIKQQKTHTNVVIPFLSANIETILNKWNYELPKVSDVLINRHIKTICKMAGITEQTTIKEIIGGKIIERTEPKSELICTHTARRSCITNLYLSKYFDTTELRCISGHKTEKAFTEYLCMTGDEMASRMAAKPKIF